MKRKNDQKNICNEKAELGGKRLGIIGGTFNPVHIGHLLLAEWALDFAELDQILFIPTGFPYLKKEPPVLGGEERLRMVEMAVSHREDFLCSDIEVKRKGHTYTYETLEALSETYPDSRFFFIAGADCLETIEHWRYPEKIFKSCTLIAAIRSGTSLAEMKIKKLELTKRYSADILLMPFPDLAISSTNIRERIKQGKSIRYLLPDNIIKYIKDNSLYIDI